MKKQNLILFFLIVFFFNIKNTYAFSSSDYVNRQTCGSFEIASFRTDGSIVTVSCHNNFEEAKTIMKQNGGEDLAILNRFANETRILDANVALVDLTRVGSSTTFNIFPTSELTGSAFTYMVGGYGGTDGALLDTGYSIAKDDFVAKIKIGNYTGWVKKYTYEIVPITWVKSSSSYTITDEIRHNYVSKITEYDYNGSGRTIGPKPTMLNQGTYYSYDGHYFYNNLSTMIKDYKAGNYNNSVNKGKPYYNYYQYLSNHTRTNYSSINIDEYLRNNLGYGRDVYGTSASSVGGISTSKLYGKGAFFYYAQENYGANALLTLSLARNESGNGRSNISINKNNGFGMNAVDSNPYQASSWFPTFMNSIYEFAQYYITYGYLDPNDWRYYGPQFGNKGIGMNVKYASDVYWSEKMASNYYYFDKAFGLQDYDYYQLGVTNGAAYAYSKPTTNSKGIYLYRKEESAVVIVDEVEGQEIYGNTKWYKVVSDMNIDSNFNELTSGNYNWNAYVYVPAAYIQKINNGKNGYISPNEVTEYQDKGYTYDLFVENATFKPKVAVSVKETNYYYDPTLLSKKNQKLLNDRYVMVFGAAYDKNKKVVSYLVTSDYWYDQKHWVSADSITFKSSRYGQASVTVPNSNSYTWINYNKEDAEYSKIGGLFTYAYIPILGEEYDGYGNLWYKVPYDLSGTSYTYGYTLASFTDVKINTYEYKASNSSPVITAHDRVIVQGKDYDEKEGVTATDPEDGDITHKIEVINNTVDKNNPGEYEITYKVADNNSLSVTKTIKVTVIKDEAPVITTTPINTTIGKQKPNLLENVTVTDKEDEIITEGITVDDSNVKYDEVGNYTIIYKVKDSFGNETTKEETLSVGENKPPVIYATDKTIVIDSKFEPKQGVTAYDEEDGDITENIKVTKDEVKEDELGTYEVTYQVTDKHNHTVEKTIKVTVSDKQEKEASFFLDYIKEVSGKLQIKGYNTIKGIDNTLDTNITYKLVYKNMLTNNEIMQVLTRITDKTEISRPVYSEDNKDYTYSWFKGEIDVDNLPNGDYKIYIVSESDEYYSKTVISNKVLRTQIATFESKNILTTRNNYLDVDLALELIIRNKKIADKTTNSVYNQYNQYRTLAFEDEKLHIMGTAYSIGMDLNKKAKVKRRIIFEETTSFQKYEFNIGSITDGLYEVGTTLGDKLSKDRAWFDSTIDITNIPKGNYAIYIATEANVNDYSELNELLFRNIDSVKLEANNKKYSFKVNEKLRYRIELIVE